MLLRAASVREQVSPVRPGLTSRSAHPIDGVITFLPMDPNRILRLHQDALILTLGVSDFDVRQILIDPGSSTDLLQESVIKQMGFVPSNLENLGGYCQDKMELLQHPWATSCYQSKLALLPLTYNSQWWRTYPNSMPYWDALGCTT